MNLLEVYPSLPKNEIRRIQKSLACIFPLHSNISKHLFSEMLYQNYERYIQNFFLLQEETHFNDKINLLILLLKNFACYPISTITKQQQMLLEKEAYGIFIHSSQIQAMHKHNQDSQQIEILASYPNDFFPEMVSDAKNEMAQKEDSKQRTSFHIVGEFLKVLSHFTILFPDKLPFHSFLFFSLYRLSLRERKAWFRWLQLPDNPYHHMQCDPILLYSHLAKMHTVSPLDECIAKNFLYFIRSNTLYLEDFFSPQNNKNQISWFYKKVMSFYRALMEQENLLISNSVQSQKEKNLLLLIQLFKWGYIVLQKENGEAQTRQLNFKMLPESIHGNILEICQYKENSYKPDATHSRWRIIPTEEHYKPVFSLASSNSYSFYPKV